MTSARMMSAGVASALALLLVLLIGASPASAHATLVLTVHHDGRGSVSVDVAWDDGHPLTEAVASTLMAFSAAGEQIGPAALTQLPGRPAVVYDGALSAGNWQVTVDVAFPGIGHCEAQIRVPPRNTGSAPAPSATRCGNPVSADADGAESGATRATAEAPSAVPGGWPVWVTAAAGFGVLAVALLLLRRRAAAPSGKPARRRR